MKVSAKKQNKSPLFINNCDHFYVNMPLAPLEVMNKIFKDIVRT